MYTFIPIPLTAIISFSFRSNVGGEVQDCSLPFCIYHHHEGLIEVLLFFLFTSGYSFLTLNPMYHLKQSRLLASMSTIGRLHWSCPITPEVNDWDSVVSACVTGKEAMRSGVIDTLKKARNIHTISSLIYRYFTNLSFLCVWVLQPMSKGELLENLFK
jgi:hypothetical protein